MITLFRRLKKKLVNYFFVIMIILTHKIVASSFVVKIILTKWSKRFWNKKMCTINICLTITKCFEARCITMSILFWDDQTMNLILKAMLLIVMASLKKNETIDQPTINNSLQTNRLQTCAILHKAQATCTCTRINSFILCVMLANQRPWMIDMKKIVYFFIQKFQS